MIAVTWGVVAVAATISPEDATSNLGGWLEKLHAQWLADLLPPNVDTYAGSVALFGIAAGLLMVFWPTKKEETSAPISSTTINNITNINSPIIQANSAVIDAVFDGKMRIKEAANVSSITDRGGGTYTIAFAKPFSDNRYGVIPLGNRAQDFEVTHSSTASTTIHFSRTPTHLALKFLKEDPPLVIAPSLAPEGRDVWLKDAIWRAFSGKWEPAPKMDFSGPGMGQAESDRLGDIVHKQVKQLALDGDLPIWGKQFSSGAWHLIPKEFWIDHNLNWSTFYKGAAETLETDDDIPVDGLRSNMTGVWKELKTNRAKVEKLWPSANISA